MWACLGVSAFCLSGYMTAIVKNCQLSVIWWIMWVFTFSIRWSSMQTHQCHGRSLLGCSSGASVSRSKHQIKHQWTYFNWKKNVVGDFYDWSKSEKLFITNSINISFPVSRIDGTFLEGSVFGGGGVCISVRWLLMSTISMVLGDFRQT